MAFPSFALLKDGLAFLEENSLSHHTFFHQEGYIKQETETWVWSQSMNFLRTLIENGGKWE